MVLAPLPLRLARNRYLTPEVPFMVTLENEQVPFPFADAYNLENWIKESDFYEISKIVD